MCGNCFHHCRFNMEIYPSRYYISSFYKIWWKLYVCVSAWVFFYLVNMIITILDSVWFRIEIKLKSTRCYLILTCHWQAFCGAMLFRCGICLLLVGICWARLNRQGAAPPSVCYGDLGCFENNSPFQTWKDLPQDPATIATNYLLYTRSNRNAEQAVAALHPDRLQQTHFSGSRKTKIIVHGFSNNGHNQWIMDMKDALLDKVSNRLLNKTISDNYLLTSILTNVS